MAELELLAEAHLYGLSGRIPLVKNVNDRDRTVRFDGTFSSLRDHNQPWDLQVAYFRGGDQLPNFSLSILQRLNGSPAGLVRCVMAPDPFEDRLKVEIFSGMQQDGTILWGQRSFLSDAIAQAKMSRGSGPVGGFVYSYPQDGRDKGKAIVRFRRFAETIQALL